ncbi:MAG: hypothetical protein WBL80_03525 [Erysipelotrichaceae bacterium]
MAFLHNGNLNPTTIFSFYPCIRDSVYLEGLKEGDTIQSENPYFFQNANGYLAIDDRFTSFKIMRDGKLIQSINLSWNKLCATETSVTPNSSVQTRQASTGISSLMVLSVGILVVVVTRRFFRARK